MKPFWAFVKKEFFHILRDKRSLFVLFGMPIVQILIFGFALTNEVKDSNIAVLDKAKDFDSHAIIQRLTASGYFNTYTLLQTDTDIEAAFRKGKIKMVVVFPPQFRADLEHQKKAQIQLIADGADPNTATTMLNYASTIIARYQQEKAKITTLPLSIGIETRMLYNPQLRGAYNFVPGVMAMILLLISAMMTAVAIVREKELGTMEILLVSPMRPIFVIIAKMLPYLWLSLGNFASILIISVTLLDLPIHGSLLLLSLVSILYISCALALGLFISTITDSQREALLVSLMILMMPTILFTGFMFPLENMPLAMQIASNIMPSKWYFSVVRDVMIKGLGWRDIWQETSILAGMTLIFIGISVFKYKIRLES